MNEIANIVATLYPVGYKFGIYERREIKVLGEEPSVETVDEFLDLIECDNVVLVSEPGKWLPFVDDEDYDDIAPLTGDGRILKKALMQYSFERIPLGFQDNTGFPWWSPIYEAIETEGFKESFEPSLQWLFDNFYPAIISQYEPTPVNEAEAKTSALVRVYKKKNPDPPFQYSALVDFSTHVETSTDWESGMSEIDYIEIEPVRLVELWPKLSK